MAKPYMALTCGNSKDDLILGNGSINCCADETELLLTVRLTKERKKLHVIRCS